MAPASSTPLSLQAVQHWLQTCFSVARLLLVACNMAPRQLHLPHPAGKAAPALSLTVKGWAEHLLQEALNGHCLLPLSLQAAQQLCSKLRHGGCWLLQVAVRSPCQPTGSAGGYIASQGTASVCKRSIYSHEGFKGFTLTPAAVQVSCLQ